MKISTIASLLLISSSAGFAPSHAPPRVAGSSAPLRFGYLDTLEKESKSMERPNVGIPGEDAETIALASSLGIDDIVIRQEYGKWLARYDKSFDLTRYPQFKKNFLVQFQNDMKHGKFYTLNEFGDCNEGMLFSIQGLSFFTLLLLIKIAHCLLPISLQRNLNSSSVNKKLLSRSQKPERCESLMRLRISVEYPLNQNQLQSSLPKNVPGHCKKDSLPWPL
jgi:hypothetical protein